MLQMNKEVTAEAVTAMSEPPAATGLFLVFASEKYYPRVGLTTSCAWHCRWRKPAG